MIAHVITERYSRGPQIAVPLDTVGGEPAGGGHEEHCGGVKGGQPGLEDNRPAQHEGGRAEKACPYSVKLATEAVDTDRGADGEQQADAAGTVQASDTVAESCEHRVEPRRPGEECTWVFGKVCPLNDVLEHTVAHVDVKAFVLKGAAVAPRQHRQGHLTGAEHWKQNPGPGVEPAFTVTATVPAGRAGLFGAYQNGSKEVLRLWLDLYNGPPCRAVPILRCVCGCRCCGGCVGRWRADLAGMWDRVGARGCVAVSRPRRGLTGLWDRVGLRDRMGARLRGCEPAAWRPDGVVGPDGRAQLRGCKPGAYWRGAGLGSAGCARLRRSEPSAGCPGGDHVSRRSCRPPPAAE